MKETLKSMPMIDKAIKNINKGLNVNSWQIFAEILPRARFREEVNLDLYIRSHEANKHLMFVKVFKGRPPYYKPWIELFDIQPEIKIESKIITYFDSPFENGILTFFSEALLPGQNLFVEYYRDIETLYQLQRDIPFPATRLGFILYRLGFFWSKDWYFPEGFMEGEQKLQVEKPLNLESEQRQKRLIIESLNSFVSIQDSNPNQNVFIKQAQERAMRLI
jgi:hypothetical protein